jgi:molecular chaperone GrpE
MSDQHSDNESAPDHQASNPSVRPQQGVAAGPGRLDSAASDGRPQGGPTSDETSASPDGTDERVVAELTARIAELEDLRLRALADLDNLRKRCAAQVRTAEAEAAARVAAQWLPVVDNLDRALAHAQADPRSIIEGVRAVRDQAVGVLGQLGYPRREDLGAPFDPVRHEAIATRSDPGVPAGSVVEVIRPAYGEDVRQLRPAQVVVAKAD